MAQLADNSNGTLSYDSNELLNRSRILDPAAFRGQKHAGGGSAVVKFSADRLTGDGHRDYVEMGYVLLKENEQYPNGACASMEFWAKAPYAPSEDKAYRKLMAVNWDGVEYQVPVVGGGGAGQGHMLRSGNGRVVLNAQDDGNLVLYVDGVPVRALFGLPPDQLW